MTYHQKTSIGKMTSYEEIIEIEITKDKEYFKMVASE